MSSELPPPVLSVSLVKIELPTVIKNEPLESEIVEIGIDDILNSSESEEEIIPDVKGIDIVYHPVCQESIKSEKLESYHYETVQTQVLVKAENSSFIKTENITQRNKTKNTSNENVTKGTGQAVVEVQGSNEYSNVLRNIETDAQLGLNSLKGLNGIIGTRSRKAKHPDKTKFAKCYKTVETNSWEKDKEKIKVIKAPVILVEAHEYTSFAKDRHVCNHCQCVYNKLKNLKRHIKRMHREVTTMYQCPYCPYKSKWNVQKHIIQKHKDTKDIQWFQCNVCEKKFKLKGPLTQHMKVHLKHKQKQDGLDLREKRYHCDKCDYKTYTSTNLKHHKFNHLKPEKIQYFYCYHCSYKSKQKGTLKRHIFTHHFKNVKQAKSFRHHCDKCNYKTDRSTNLKSHKLIHLKPDEIQYFYCYHCSYTAKRKDILKRHIFIHFKKEQVKFNCYICNFMTQKRESIIQHIKKHSKVQIKFQINESTYKDMSREPQPPVLSVSLVKIEPPTVIKNEPPESEIGINDILDESEEKIISDLKDIDIVYHPVCNDSIKREILESYHYESVETQVLVKVENTPFIKTENLTQRNKTEDTSDENVTKGTGQAVVEVQASNEHSNALSNLETDEQSVFNFSKNLNSISVRSRKSKSPKKTDFAECYKTDDTTLREKEKIKVIKAPVIPVEAHEYTSLVKDRHVCNHCQYACNRLDSLKRHIKQMHREVTTLYQCPYCPYKTKWKEYIIKEHIIRKHKNTKDIQWVQCHLCEKKFKLKYALTKHKKVHITQEQMQDGLDLKRYHCNKCNYKTDRLEYLKNHKIIHLKPEEIEYFYCYHCSYKSKLKFDLKNHIFRQHFKNVKQGKRHHCDKCEYKTYASTNLKRHKLTHFKPEEIQYFYCYHCSYKTTRKWDLKKHIFIHFKKEQVKFDCYICNFITPKRESIIIHIKKHSKV